MRPEEILGLLPHLYYGSDHSPGFLLFFYELLFWIIVVLLAFGLIRFRPALLEKAELRLSNISQHTRLWLMAFPLSLIVLRVSLLPLIPVPIPVVHDEFSYLLQADTFSHGRLTNPPSPMGMHFESFHINISPTYQSMYPPAHALALAIGQKLTAVPWVGVLLSTAAMCGAIYWMLLGWLPPGWAWLGGAFAVLRYGIFSYWINSYFGGSVTALGGALLLGALPRLKREPRTWTAVIFVLGLLTLANSRPLEGLCFSIPIALSAIVYSVKNGSVTWTVSAKKLMPAFVLLIAGLGWMLYYNWRGTGNPLLMPYVLNFKTYHISKPFLFAKPNPIPEYRHEAMRAFYVYHEFHDLLRLKYEGVGYFLRLRATVFYGFFLWPFLLLAAPALYAMSRDREFRVVLMAVGLMAADLFAQIWPPEGHYAAPAAGAMILLALYALRHFRKFHPGYGTWACRAIVIVFAVWLVSPVVDSIVAPYVAEADSSIPLPMEIQRERIKSDMEARNGKQLLIVHGGYHEVPWMDWIYNDADIDHSHVIWARDMGYLKNQELLDYYPDRQVWYVDRGDTAFRIVPYDQAMATWQLAFSPGLFELPSREVNQRARKNVMPPQAPDLRSVSLSRVDQSTH